MSDERIYVLQVVGGRERHVCKLIRNILPADSFSEVFAPRYIKRVRRQGEWQAEELLLTPGYLYIKTDDIARVSDQLRRVPALTKLLRSADSIQPLAQEETSWLASLTTSDERTIDVSYGFVEGDRVVITSGPLLGHESLIAKIDRHKRLAYLQFHILGRTKIIKVGLEVVKRTG